MDSQHRQPQSPFDLQYRHLMKISRHIPILRSRLPARFLPLPETPSLPHPSTIVQWGHQLLLPPLHQSPKPHILPPLLVRILVLIHPFDPQPSPCLRFLGTFLWTLIVSNILMTYASRLSLRSATSIAKPSSVSAPSSVLFKLHGRKNIVSRRFICRLCPSFS